MLPGIINVDFADVRSVMSNAGVALMGLGRGVGDQRAKMAAQHAATSPLLETSIQGAKRLLVNVTAGPDFSLGEAHEAMEYILQFTDAEDADIIMGHVMRDDPDGEVQVTLLAAGMDADSPTHRTHRESAEVFDRPEPSHVASYKTPEPAPEPPKPVVQPKPEPIKIEWPRNEAAPKSAETAVAVETEPVAAPIDLNEIDLDIPTFLRRNRGQSGD